MDADGSDPILFTVPFASPDVGTRVQDEHPSWSPDGTQIAFARSHQNGSRFVMTKVADPEALAVTVTPLPSDDTDHTFDLPDWQPRAVE
jgi:Tol biopolymer transport system component